jgi:hypothetical protein
MFNFISNLFPQSIWKIKHETYKYCIHILQEVHLVSDKNNSLILECALQTFLQNITKCQTTAEELG